MLQDPFLIMAQTPESRPPRQEGIRCVGSQGLSTLHLHRSLTRSVPPLTTLPPSVPEAGSKLTQLGGGRGNGCTLGGPPAGPVLLVPWVSG